ncbi:hypothetical protein Ae406Ps2_1469 [Pseudonocardia sp. Ae406_Ps2]|nr:hypothetical protein Ae406Ps2_1465 [Pseudonocardia sp. Ae406_Ps2]OLM01469.1 hypothetical protein Ae406Ps2_1469 [Pseudonocardia sp. Ae406_Ps2]
MTSSTLVVMNSGRAVDDILMYVASELDDELPRHVA